MGRPKDGVFIEGLLIDPEKSVPMHRQLYTNLREMILSGALPGGTRMPSSRTLSQHLSVSRFTVVTALDQLTAEGYLWPVKGRGTYVETIARIRTPTLRKPGKKFTLSQRAQNMTWRNSRVSNRSTKILHMTSPDHRLFPHEIWAKLTKNLFANMDPQVTWYRTPDEPSFLEQQIASQIAVSRGIQCDPEEVVTTLGAHHSMTLLADLLLDPGDNIAVEEPGMQAIHSMFLSHGCTVLPMSVDEHGANPDSLPNARIKLAFVTAAKQQPLTIAMPVKRKLELLDWAAKNNATILEDDLGSEYRYEGRPIPPLKALDQHDNVIYAGAFSMSLLQTLRVGYLIMPRHLAAQCRRLIQIRYRATPQITELMLAHFIADGHYSRHLHKTRRIYAKRQEYMLNILRNDFADIFEPPDTTAGFYNICYFKDQSINDGRLLSLCNKRGIGVEQLSHYYGFQKPLKKAFLIGFAASDEAEITQGLKILRDCLPHNSG